MLEAMRTVGATAGLLTDTRVVRRYLGPVLLVVVAFVLSALAATFGYVVVTNVTKLKDQVTTFFAAVAGVSSLIAAAGVLLAGVRQNQASRALHVLRTHEGAFSAAVADVESEHRRELLEATAEHERVRSVFADSEARVSEARRAVTVAASRRADVASSSTLRAVASAYRAADQSPETLRLVIRSDLEALSGLLSFESLPMVAQRLVVYIDGLDQCGPHTTVEFLEAVQQLLAFPAFAVVVVADPRHVASALSTVGVLSPLPSGADELSPEAIGYLASSFRSTSESRRWGRRASGGSQTSSSPDPTGRRGVSCRGSPIALQAHLAVGVLAPADAGLYADVVAGSEARTLKDLFDALIRDRMPKRLWQTRSHLARRHRWTAPRPGGGWGDGGHR